MIRYEIPVLLMEEGCVYVVRKESTHCRFQVPSDCKGDLGGRKLNMSSEEDRKTVGDETLGSYFCCSIQIVNVSVKAAGRAGNSSAVRRGSGGSSGCDVAVVGIPYWAIRYAGITMEQYVAKWGQSGVWC
jgi:hypothetical protein